MGHRTQNTEHSEILVDPDVDVYTLESDPGAPHAIHPLNLGKDEPALLLLDRFGRAAIYPPYDGCTFIRAGAEEGAAVGTPEDRLKWVGCREVQGEIGVGHWTNKRGLSGCQCR